MASLSIPKDLCLTPFIDGRFLPASADRAFTLENPATLSPTVSVTAASEAEVDAAVAAAKRSHEDPSQREKWRENPELRRKALLRIADLIESRLERLAVVETLTNGKTLADARADTEECAAVFRECAKHVGRNEAPRRIEVPDDDYETVVVSRPIGVCGLISPWNYSLLMPVWKVAPSLAAGCSVVLKPSELTPVAALELAQIAHEAGVPPGVFNVIPGAGLPGARLSAHPDVRKVSFTGSVATGKKVMHACAERAAVCTLELGGKSPIIVFDDVDLDAAVEWIMFGVFNNQGQVCSATSRLLVHSAIADRLVKRLAQCAKDIVVGPGDHPDSKVGPLISRAQFAKVMAFIDEARSDPSITVAAGGGRPSAIAGGGDPSSGLYVSPTVLVGVPSTARVWREEVFGPVLCVQTFTEEGDAIRRANEGEFGLAAAVMSRDEARCQRVAEAIDAGVCWINCSQPAFCTAPWGGWKQSGVGRELGTWGVEAFQEIKQITRAKDPSKQVGFFTMAKL